MNILKVDTSTRLKQIMNERNLKQVDIIRMSEPYQKELDIKMGKSTLSQYVNGVQSPDQDRIYLLSKTLNVSEPWLMGFDVAKDRVPDGKRTETKERKDILSIYNQLVPPRQEKVYNFAERQLEEQNRKVVPLFGTTAANPTELSYGDINMEDTIEINVPKKAECALVVKGDSMEPEYQNGDIVFYKSQPAVENGEMAIVEIDGDGVTLKKVYYNYDDDKVVLRSLNGKYEDRELEPERVRILGKVVK